MPPPKRKKPVRTRVPESLVPSLIGRKIDDVIALVRKKYGPESIGRLGDDPEPVPATFPTGLANLDRAIGLPGWPLAKLVEISGPPSVGKSALVKKLVASAIAAGVTPYFIDSEQSQDTPERYAALDIDTRHVAWTEEVFLEDAFAKADLAIESLAKRDGQGFVVIDSIMMMLKTDAARGYDESARRAARAGFLSDHLPRLVSKLKGTCVGLAVVNQIRQRPNVAPFQDPYYEPGGYALGHFAHMIIRLTPAGRIGRGEDATGVKTKATVRKSKLSPPFKTALLGIHFDGRVTEMVDDDDD